MNIEQKLRCYLAQQYRLWGLLLLLGMPILSHATHIVGGEIGYRCLGNNNYEIIVRLYRDCINGANDAPFDDPASVGIFNRNGELLQDVRIKATKDTFLSNNLDACIKATSEVCVHTMTYRAEVCLPFRPGGYQIVYQRCCRNKTILNIVNPLQTGATYDIWLTEAALLRCNSSAAFRRWPDIYICNNRQLDFDHSAIDADGDSLVYRLCTPLQGATLARPKPQPPNRPPYDTLVWVKPLYSLQNMLGVGEPLRINANSGLLTARPGLLGQFVVGVCVDEYDRKTKKLISSTRRDFQYNVQNCEDISAAFSAPESQCDSLKMSFRNESIGADDYLWLFDAPRTQLTSTEVNPVFTFPAFNTYKVSLIAEPNTACADTFSRDIRLFKSEIKADFEAEVLPCLAGSIVRLKDLSTDSTASIVKRIWKVTLANGDQITATGADTLVRLPASSTGTITLTVINVNGCEKSITKNYSSSEVGDPLAGIPDTLQGCVGTSISLNPKGTATNGYSYRWKPAGAVDDSTAVNPMFRVTQSGTATVTLIVGSDQACIFSKTITILATPGPDTDFSVEGGVGTDPIVVSSCDGRTLNLKNLSTGADSVKWVIGSLNNPLVVSTANNPVLTLGDTGTYTITLIAYGICNDTLQKTVKLVRKETDVDFNFNYTSCILNGSTIQLLDVSDNPGVQITRRTWKLSDGRSSTEASPSFSFTDTGQVKVTLIIETAEGCLDSTSQNINKAPISGVDIPDTITVCRGAPLPLPGRNNPNLVYMWLPETGLDDPTVGNPVFSPQQSTLYTVNISVPGIPACQTNDTMMAVVPGNMGVTVVGAGADGTPVCTPQTNLRATANRPASFRWLDVNGTELAKGDQFTATVAIHRNLTVEATDTNGCIEKLEISLVGSPINFTAPDSVIVCTNESLRINTTQGAGQTLTYTWTPANAFESGTSTATPLLAANPGIKEVFVQVRNAAGCILNDSVQVIIIDANHNLDFIPEVQCDGNTVKFRNTSTNAFAYHWDFGDGTSSKEENPEHRYADSGTYSVTLTLAYDATCRKTVSKELEITAGTAIGLKVPSNKTTCGEKVTLTAGGKTGVEFKWTTKQGELISSDSSVTVAPPPGVTFYYVTATNELGCVEKDSVSVTNNGVDVTLITPSGSNRIDQCVADSVQIEVRNNQPTQQLTYSWTPAANVVSGANTATPILRPTTNGTNTITGIISNQFECEDTLTVVITLGTLESGLPDTVKVCPGVATPLGPNANTAHSFQWSPATGLSATNIPNPNFTGISPITYSVTVTKNSDGVSCQIVDTVVVTINPKPELKVSSLDTSACAGTTLSLVATGASEYAWFLVGTTPPPFNADGSIAISGNRGTELRYTVIGRNGAACTDTISGIRVRFVDFDLEDFPSPLSVCQNDTLELHPNGNPNLQYQWSPATGLDLSKPYNPVVVLNQNTTFQVTITDPQTGCVKERSFRVEVNKIEGFEATNDTIICSAAGGFMLRADADGANVFFRWLDANGQQIGNGKTLTVNPSVGENRYVIEANNGTCTRKDTVKVTLIDFQPGDLSSPQTACAGEPLALNPKGNPAYVYNWSPTTGLDLTTPHNPIATLSTSVTYKVTVKDTISGCSLEKEIRVNVTDLSDLAIVPADTSVCQPGGVNLRITGAAGANIRWLDANGNEIGTGRSFSPSPNIGLNLYIAVASLGSCSARDTSRVTRIDFQPGDLSSPQTACAGSPLPLNPNGNPAYTYTWSPTTGLNLTNPHHPIATLNTSTTYTVTVTDPVTGCSLTKEIQVNVTDLSDLEAVPSETILCQPDFIFLTVRGAQGANIRWLDANGQVIFVGRSLSVTPGPGLNLYIAEARLGECTRRDTARVILNDFDPGELKSPQSICKGSSVELNPDGNPAYTYTWSPTTGLDLSKPHNPVASPVSTTTYSVTVTDPVTNCTTTKDIVVNVTAPLTIMALPDTSLCEPGRLTLRAITSRPTSVTWFSNAQLTNQIGTGNRVSVNVGAGKTVFYAVATDLNDLCIRARVDSVKQNGGASIGKGGPFEGAPVDSAVVDVVDITTGAPPSMVTTCADRPTPINPNGKPNLMYRWSPATGLNDSTSATPTTIVTVPTTYTVTISDPFGVCSIVRQVAVMAAEPIRADAGRDTILCSLNPFTLNASGNGATVFEWANNRDINPIIGRGAQFAITPDTVSRTYYVRITNAAGCTEIDSVRVIARPVNATLPATVNACESGDELTLRVTNRDARQTLTYLWSPANLFITNVRTGPTATLVAQSGAQPQVVVTNQFGCSATLRTTVNIVDLPNRVRVTANPSTIELGQSSTINVQVANCTNCTYSWSPATGLNTTTGSTVIASPTDTTEYTVKVTSDSCMAEFKVTVNVSGPYCIEPYIFVPTAFTPNRDGVNDVLYVRGRGIDIMTFIIYNRWNEKVFETSDPSVGWDGTFRGRALPPDVYGFYLIATCIDGTVYRKQGNVTLIR